MSASVAKNEVTAAKRTVLVTVLDPSGAPAWRGSSLVGRAFVGSTSSLVAAAGTWANVRKPFSITATTFTADNTTEKFTAADHGLETGDGPFTVSSTTTLPAGLAAATNYWIIRINANTFYLASSLANAYAGTVVAITDNGTGTHTISSGATTERGLDAEFLYTLTQTETNIDASELLVVTNDKRRAITGAAATDLITLASHELYTGMAVIVAQESGTLPTGLADGGYYFAIRVDANTFKLATTQANAFAGTAIDLTADSAGVIYLEPAVYPGRVSVGMDNGVADLWAYVIENGKTAADLFRGMARQVLAKRIKSGSTETTRDLADTKDSHHGTVTGTGRTVVIDDLT